MVLGKELIKSGLALRVREIMVKLYGLVRRSHLRGVRRAENTARHLQVPASLLSQLYGGHLQMTSIIRM